MGRVDFHAIESQYLPNRKPGAAIFKSLEGKEYGAKGPFCFWYPRHAKFVPKAGEGKWNVIHPADGRRHPTTIPGPIRCYSGVGDDKYELPDPTVYRSESFNELIHRAYRVVEAASNQDRHVIMTSHCDLANMVGAYPLYTAMCGRNDEMHDFCMPHPKRKEFPWFGFDQEFQKSDYVGQSLVAMKGSVYTLEFAGEQITNQGWWDWFMGRRPVYPKAGSVVSYSDDADISSLSTEDREKYNNVDYTPYVQQELLNQSYATDGLVFANMMCVIGLISLIAVVILAVCKNNCEQDERESNVHPAEDN